MANNDNCLRIWRYTEAPEEYKALGLSAGDEEWLLFAPASTKDKYWPLSLESVINGVEGSFLEQFGHVHRKELEDGSVVVVFCHA